MLFEGVLWVKALILKALSVSCAASQALMPKRCNVLLEAVKELPPLQVLEMKGDGLCHDRATRGRPVGPLRPLCKSQPQSKRLIWHFDGKVLPDVC